MKNYVRLAGAVAAENIAINDDADIKAMFHPSIKLIAVNAPVAIGSVYDEAGNTFGAAPVPIPSKDELIAHAAARRYIVETGGITVAGVNVATDRESQSMLNAAYNIAQGNAQFSTMWKGADGNFTQIDAPTLIALAQAVGAFVASCFAAEAAAVMKIKTGDFTSVAQIDAAIVVPA